MISGYTRVSTKGQARDGNSLEAQELLEAIEQCLQLNHVLNSSLRGLTY